MSFHSLLDHFYKETGIEFQEKRDIIDRKVSRFYEERGYQNYHDFFTAVKDDRSLYQELINLLTTSETYFYREFSQIELCIEQIKNASCPIKVLSAPCASGEEPYSLLIAMLEAKIDLDTIDIYGIDINTDEIERAKTGTYSQRRLHKLPQSIQERYFNRLENGDYQIIPELQKHIHFKQMNLFERFPSDFNNFDVIFSRNMLIYFDQNAQEKAEKIFYEKLRRGGLLFLGHADKIHLVTPLNKMSSKGTSYYIK